MMNKLTENKIPILYLIGANGAGKSYALSKALSQLPNEAIYISEEGISNIINQKNKISIDIEKRLYVYIDEKTRGGDTKSEQQNIEDKSLNIIKFCNSIINDLKRFSNKSQGQKKLQNVMDIFLKYNLNNLRYILFDEPENFLDENYLKIITDLVKLLIKNQYRVRIATHNSRLLALLRVEIDDIIFCVNRKGIQISTQEVETIFKEIALKVEKERILKKYEIDPSIKYKLEITHNTDVFLNYIENNLKNVEFFRCLFYQEIYIVEGISDLEALNSIYDSFKRSVNIYCPNGKAWIPFYAILFNKIGKKVTVIIDEDIKNKHASTLTSVLDEINNICVIKHNPDMEDFYGIDKTEIGKSLGMSNKILDSNKGWLKQLAAFCFFKSPINQEKLKNHIFKQNEDTEYEFK